MLHSSRNEKKKKKFTDAKTVGLQNVMPLVDANTDIVAAMVRKLIVKCVPFMSHVLSNECRIFSRKKKRKRKILKNNKLRAILRIYLALSAYMS